MNKVKKLTDKEMKIAVDAIGLSTFNFMKNKLAKQIKIIYGEQFPDPNDIVHIAINSLSSIDTNILMMTRNIFEKATNSKMDFNLMMHDYIEDILSIMNKDEKKRLKEKMN